MKRRLERSDGRSGDRTDRTDRTERTDGTGRSSSPDETIRSGKWIERLGRGIVVMAATAALCGSASIARAATYDEVVDGDLPDFAPLILDPSIDEVLGTPKLANDNDYFSFSGLDPGAPFTLFLETGPGVGISIFDIINDSGVVTEEFILDPNESQAVPSTVTTSGRINLRFAGAEEVGNYAITHDAPAAVPEPATSALLGGGLAALAARRRRDLA